MKRLIRASAHRGFTLVELLVVIGIIALLISILLPVLNKAREQAKAITCASNEKQILLAFTMYVSGNKGATPIFPGIGESFPPPNDPFEKSLGYYMDSIDSGASRIRYDQGAFWPYMTVGIHYTAVSNSSTNTNAPPEVLYRVFNCPSDTDFRAVRWGNIQNQASLDRNFSYSWNAELYCKDKSKLAGWQLWNNEPNVSKMSQIVESGHKIILEEEKMPNDGWSFMGWPNDDQDDVPGSRHNGRANYGFADGHVESFDPTDLGYQRTYGYTEAPHILNFQTGANYFHLRSNHK